MCAVGLLALFPFPPSWVSPQQASLEPLCSDGPVKGPSQTLLHTHLPPRLVLLLLHLHFLSSSPPSYSTDKLSAPCYDIQGPPCWALFQSFQPHLSISPIHAICSGHKYRLPVPPGLCLSTSPHIFTCQVVLILSLGKLLSVLSPHAASSVRLSLALPGRRPREHARHQSNYCTVLGLLFDMV